MKARLYFWSLTSALAGFLFGFDTVVISGAEQAIQAQWKLSAALHGFALASALYGTVVGSLLGGWPTDRFGRKATLIGIGALYVVSAVGCAFAGGVGSFILARFIGGLGIGVSTVVAQLYIAEIGSPAHPAGRVRRLLQPTLRNHRHPILCTEDLRAHRPRSQGGASPVGRRRGDEPYLHLRRAVAYRPHGPPDPALHRLVRLHPFPRPHLLGVLFRAFRNRAGVHLRLHRRARGRAGRGDLGADLRDLPQPPQGDRAGPGQLHALDLRRPDHDRVPERGVRVRAGLRVPVLLLHDGAAAGLGAAHGA